MNKISVIISAFNEEENIKDCLESAKWADEIIFVDNTSTDKTIQIAKKYTDKIYTRFNYPMLNTNKNFGFGKASGDWLISLDADERITPELKKEIKSAVVKNKYPGYFIPRKNMIFGKWIKHTGWYPDHQLRLFKKGKGKFPEKHVHEMVKLDGQAGYLKEHILHLNYLTVSQFIQKLDRIYTPNEAENLLEKKKAVVWQDAIRFPVKEFINRFFAQKGYKDGLHGLVLSLLMAFYHLVVFAKVWEKRGFKEEKLPFSDFVAEMKKLGKETTYWLTTSLIKETEGPVKKFLLKSRRKLSSWLQP